MTNAQITALSAHDGGTGDGRAATGKAEGKPVDYGARADAWFGGMSYDVKVSPVRHVAYMNTAYGRGMQAWQDGEFSEWTLV